MHLQKVSTPSQPGQSEQTDMAQIFSTFLNFLRVKGPSCVTIQSVV